MNLMAYLQSKLKLNEFAKDESAQGMTEYILLIVVVVGLAYAFRDKIKKMVIGKLDDTSSQMDAFKVEP